MADRPNVIGIEAQIEEGTPRMQHIMVGAVDAAATGILGTALDGVPGVLVRVGGRTVRFTTESLMAAAEDAIANADDR